MPEITYKFVVYSKGDMMHVRIEFFVDGKLCEKQELDSDGRSPIDTMINWLKKGEK